MTAPPSTRHSPPGPGPRLPRPRLAKRVVALASRHPVLWVWGPAGAGKTSLISSHVADRADRLEQAGQGDKTIWVRLEAADADAGIFLNHLRLAARQALGRKAARLPASEAFQDPADTLPAIGRALAALLPDPCLWVWDNCEHLPDDSPQMAALAEMAKGLTAGRPLICISRKAPPAAWRTRWQAPAPGVLGWPDLQLSREETRTFIDQLSGQALDEATVDTLYARSQGWLAALLLAGNRPRDSATIPSALPDPAGLQVNPSARNETDSNAGLDMLLADALDHMDKDDLRILSRAALLPYATPSLLNACLHDKSAFRRLEWIAHRLPLVERDAAQASHYSLHPLLGEHLRRRLVATRPAGDLLDPRLDAAQALAAAGEIRHAGELLLEGGHWRALCCFALEQAETLAQSDRIKTLERWLAALPDHCRAQHPWADYWAGYSRRFDQRELAWPLLARAFERFRASGDVKGQYAAWLALAEAMLVVFEDMKPMKHWLGEYEALRQRHPRCPDTALRMKTATLAGSIMSMVAPRHPRLARFIRMSEIGVRLLPFKVPRQAMFIYLIMHYGSTGQIARMHAMAAQLAPGLDDERLPAQLRIFGHAMLGLHHLISGQDSPEIHLDKAIRLVDDMGAHLLRPIPHSYRIYVDLVAGQFDQARQRLAAFPAMVPANHRMVRAAHGFMLAWLAAQEGDDAHALEHSALSRDQSASLEFDFGLALNACLCAQIRSRRGDHAGAEQDLAELARVASASGNRLLAVMHALAQAWLVLNRDGEQACLPHLGQALAQAEEEGIQAFPGLLRDMQASLVRLALAQEISPAFARRLVDRWRLRPANLSPLDTAWPWGLRIHTLGRFEVSLNGTPLDTGASGQQRPLELLAALIAAGGRGVPRTRLCDDLWPDAEADKAHHALENLVHRLRKLIGSQAVRLSAGRISLDDTLCWVDTWALEALENDADHPSTTCKGASGLLLECYRGAFLPGMEQTWALAGRSRLQALGLRLAERIGEALVAQGDDRSAIHLWERLVMLEPLGEGLYLRLMEQHLTRGRPGEAMQVYQRCRQIMEHYHGIPPGRALLALAQHLNP